MIRARAIVVRKELFACFIRSIRTLLSIEHCHRIYLPCLYLASIPCITDRSGCCERSSDVHLSLCFTPPTSHSDGNLPENPLLYHKAAPGPTLPAMLRNLAPAHMFARAMHQTICPFTTITAATKARQR